MGKSRSKRGENIIDARIPLYAFLVVLGIQIDDSANHLLPSLSPVTSAYSAAAGERGL